MNTVCTVDGAAPSTLCSVRKRNQFCFGDHLFACVCLHSIGDSTRFEMIDFSMNSI